MTQSDIDELIRKAEARGYARGYAAGKKKSIRIRSSLREYDQKNAFLQRAFLAALPSCIAQQSWVLGDGTKVTTMEQKINIAWLLAQEALDQKRYPK